MADIFRVAVSREQRIVGLITVSAAGGVTATTAEGHKVVWKARPDRLDDTTWRALEYVVGITRRADEYGTPDGADPLGYNTGQPPNVYLRQMAEDALAGRHGRAVGSEIARLCRTLKLPTSVISRAQRLRRWIWHRYWRVWFCLRRWI